MMLCNTAVTMPAGWTVLSCPPAGGHKIQYSREFFMKRIAILLSSLLAFSTLAQAGERGTPDEAHAMVKKAISFFKANGKDKTMAALNDPKGAFIDRDLYVFVHDDKGIYYAI